MNSEDKDMKAALEYLARVAPNGNTAAAVLAAAQQITEALESLTAAVKSLQRVRVETRTEYIEGRSQPYGYYPYERGEMGG